MRKTLEESVVKDIKGRKLSREEIGELFTISDVAEMSGKHYVTAIALNRYGLNYRWYNIEGNRRRLVHALDFLQFFTIPRNGRRRQYYRISDIPEEKITAAYADYKRGMKVYDLFRKHDISTFIFYRLAKERGWKMRGKILNPVTRDKLGDEMCSRLDSVNVSLRETLNSMAKEILDCMYSSSKVLPYHAAKEEFRKRLHREMESRMMRLSNIAREIGVHTNIMDYHAKRGNIDAVNLFNTYYTTMEEYKRFKVTHA